MLRDYLQAKFRAVVRGRENARKSNAAWCQKTASPSCVVCAGGREDGADGWLFVRQIRGETCWFRLSCLYTSRSVVCVFSSPVFP